MDESVESVAASPIDATPVAQEGAFEEIFLRYYGLVYQVCLRVLGSSEEADDMAQDAFLKLYCVWPKLKIRVSLKAWLCRVALNQCYNRVRALNRERNAMNKEALNSQRGASINKEMENVLARQEINTVLNKISPRDRALIFLKHLGFSYQDMADVLGVKAGSVGTLLARAQERFKVTYIKLYGGEDDEL